MNVLLTKFNCNGTEETVSLTDAFKSKAAIEAVTEDNSDWAGFIARQNRHAPGTFSMSGELKGASMEEFKKQLKTFDAFSALEEVMGAQLQQTVKKMYNEMQAATGLTKEQINEHYYISVRTEAVRREGQNYVADMVFEWNTKNINQ